MAQIGKSVSQIGRDFNHSERTNNSDPTLSADRHLSDRNSAGESDHDSLFDTLSDDDGNDIMEVGTADRQSVLSAGRLNMRDKSHLVTPQAKKRRYSASFEPSTADFISDTQVKSGLNAQDLPPSLREKGDLSSSNPGEDSRRPGIDRLEAGDVMWEYGSLLAYRVEDGKPQILVSWYPTWESPDEYSKEDVNRVKRQWE